MDSSTPEAFFSIWECPKKISAQNSNFEQKGLQRNLKAEHILEIRYLRQSQECSKVSKICSYFAVIYFYSFRHLQANSEGSNNQVIFFSSLSTVEQMKLMKNWEGKAKICLEK